MQPHRHHVATVLVVCAAASLAHGENIDPANDGSQYAYGENIGWINCEPSGDGGPGVEVNDFGLSGWMYGENIGWISLSCANTANCLARPYAVANDGSGGLSGFAWSENGGWVNFAPAGAGVSIDPVTGQFSGDAWSENMGWIRFASAGVNPFELVTEWSCDPAPSPPSATPTLQLAKQGTTALISGNGGNGSAALDLVRGSLTLLHLTGGNFSLATTECLDDNGVLGVVTFEPTPVSGQAIWFLSRDVNCGGNGSWDVGGAQLGTRDSEINASGSSCP